MRYKKVKIIETVVYDGEINDLKEIKMIIDGLKRHELDIEMRLRSEALCSHVRILNTEEDSFSFSIIGLSSSLKKRALYSDVDSIFVKGNDLYFAQVKPGMSRLGLMDHMDDFAEKECTDKKPNN